MYFPQKKWLEESHRVERFRKEEVLILREDNGHPNTKFNEIKWRCGCQLI